MKKILVTGFEPFGKDEYNPSSAAVQMLTDTNRYQLKKLILPVVWHRAFEVLSSAWDEWRPDAVLMCGQAGGSDKIRIERVGINLCAPTKDNLGLYANGRDDTASELPILSEGENAYFSTYHAEAMLSALREAKIPSTYSFSAGTYLCNYILYSALAKNRREMSDLKIGFVHVPYADGQRKNVPSLPIDTIATALELALSNMF